MVKNFQLNVVFLEALGLRNVLLTCIFGALGVIFLCGVIYIARRYLLQVLQNFYFTKSNVFDMFSQDFNFSTHFFFLMADNLKNMRRYESFVIICFQLIL